jgi:hypothetical protein
MNDIEISFVQAGPTELDGPVWRPCAIDMRSTRRSPERVVHASRHSGMG